MESEFIAAEELQGYFKSKKDLYKLLTIDLNYHLPRFSNCDLYFMRQIFQGEKKAFKKDEVQSLVVPRYKELTVSKIWEKIKDIPEYTDYFPDFDGDKLPERDYLISIISTINPEATKSVVKEAREHRSVNDCDDTQNLVAITSELKESIRKIAPQKTTRGISNHLLKCKAVLKRPRRNPREFSTNLNILKLERREDEEDERDRDAYRSSRSRQIDMEEEDKNANL